MSRANGILVIPEYDHENKRYLIRHWQDVEPIIENNKRLSNEQPRQNEYMRHIATIPHNIRLKWWIEETKGNYEIPIFSARFENEIVARKLEDPEWKYLRVDGGCNFKTGWRPK